MPSALARPVTLGSIARVLLAGFAAVILLLLAAGYFGVRNLVAVRSTAAELIQERVRTAQLLDEVLGQQRAINAIYFTFTRRPDLLDRQEMLKELETSDENIQYIADQVKGEPEQQSWDQLVSAAGQFSKEARRLLEAEEARGSPSLIRSHQQVVELVDKLVQIESNRSTQLRQRLENVSSKLYRESALLLGACLVIAVLGAAYTVRASTGLIQNLEWQAGELSRVSWHLLEKQETTARRFSHELHDELGQSLTAVKANLVSLGESVNGSRAQLDDALHLVDEAIGNVREMSQLLRPTILDDFGLSASLKWLCDRFTTRTGISVEFASNLDGRLPDAVETHLFRLAQEALTNVARHSKATRVEATLSRTGEVIQLRIADNGQGLQPAPEGVARGLGMVGMRARARNSGGELKVKSEAGRGVEVVAVLPYIEREEA